MLLDRVPVQQLPQHIPGRLGVPGLQQVGAVGVPWVAPDGVLQDRQLFLAEQQQLARVVQLVVADERDSPRGAAVDHPQVVESELGPVGGARLLVAQQERVLAQQLDAPHAHAPQRIPAAVQPQQSVGRALPQLLSVQTHEHLLLQLGQHAGRVQGDGGWVTRVARVRQEQLVVRVAEEVADRAAALHQTGTPCPLLGGYPQQVYALHHGGEHGQGVPVQPDTQARTYAPQLCQAQQHLQPVHDPARAQRDEQQVRDGVLVGQQLRGLLGTQARLQVALSRGLTGGTVGRGREGARGGCLSVGSDQEAGVTGEEEAVVGTEENGGLWGSDVVLETEGLVEDAVGRGVSDRVSRDASVAVDGEGVPVRSKRHQLSTVWSGLYAVSECVEADFAGL